jgi:hypothetical protein
MIKANVRAASIERLSDQWERHAYGRTLILRRGRNAENGGKGLDPYTVSW